MVTFVFSLLVRFYETQIIANNCVSMIGSRKDIHRASTLDLKFRKAKVQIHRWWNNHHYNGNPNNNAILLTSRPKNAPFISLRNDEYSRFLENVEYMMDENIPLRERASTKLLSGKVQQPPLFKAKSRKIVAGYTRELRKVTIKSPIDQRRKASPVERVPVIKYEKYNRIPIYQELSMKINKMRNEQLKLSNNSIFMEENSSLYELEKDLIENCNDTAGNWKMSFGEPKRKPQRVLTPCFEDYVYGEPLPRLPITADFTVFNETANDTALNGLHSIGSHLSYASQKENSDCNGDDDKENRLQNSAPRRSFPRYRCHQHVPESYRAAPQPTLKTLFHRGTPRKSNVRISNIANGKPKSTISGKFDTEEPYNEQRHMRPEKAKRQRRLQRRRKIMSLFKKLSFHGLVARDHSIRLTSLFKWLKSIYNRQAKEVGNIIDPQVFQDPDFHIKVIDVLSLNAAKVASNGKRNKEDLNNKMTNQQKKYIPALENNRRRNFTSYVQPIDNVEQELYLDQKFERFPSHKTPISPNDTYKEEELYANGLFDDYGKTESASDA